MKYLITEKDLYDLRKELQAIRDVIWGHERANHEYFIRLQTLSNNVEEFLGQEFAQWVADKEFCRRFK